MASVSILIAAKVSGPAANRPSRINIAVARPVAGMLDEPGSTSEPTRSG